MNLTLVPTYSLDLVLQSDTGTLALVPASALALVMTEAYRGPAGYGLLGVAEVAAGDPVDLSLPVGVYLLTLAADQELAFTGGSAALNRKRLLLDITQGPGGGHNITPGASVNMSTDLPAFELSAGEGKTDALAFMYRHETGKCQYMAIIHG